MNETLKAKRAVHVCLGKPEGYEESYEDEQTAHLVSNEDSYYLTMVEAGEESFFTIVASCLCSLTPAAEMWLMGGSRADVIAAIAKADGNHGAHG